MLDEQVIIDKTITDQISIWKSSRGLTDKMVPDHACSGETCTYYHIGDVFVCEKTGNVHGKKGKLLTICENFGFKVIGVDGFLFIVM